MVNYYLYFCFFNIENCLIFLIVYILNIGGGDLFSLDCICKCNNGVFYFILIEDEVEIVVSEIWKNFIVLKVNLLFNIRKRISVSDF